MTKRSSGGNRIVLRNLLHKFRVWLRQSETGYEVMLFVRGHGYLVIVFYFGALALTQIMVDHLCGKGFYAFNAWPKYVAVAVGSLLCWAVGKWLNSGATRRRVDPQTGEEMVVPRKRHDFMFIKVEHRGLIGAIACIVFTALSEFRVV